MPNKSLVATMAVLAVAVHSTEAFAPPASGVRSSMPNLSPLYAEESTEESAVFMPPPEAEEPAEEGDIDLKTVELLGRGAAKVCIWVDFSLPKLERQFDVVAIDTFEIHLILSYLHRELRYGFHFDVCAQPNILFSLHLYFLTSTGQARKAQGRTRCQKCRKRQGLGDTGARGGFLRRTPRHHRNYYSNRLHPDRHRNRSRHRLVVATGMGSIQDYLSPHPRHLRNRRKGHGRDRLPRHCRNANR